MLRSLIGAAIVLALTACTSAVTLRHPATGAVATCGPYYTVGFYAFAANERERQCIQDYQRQGYQRVPRAPPPPRQRQAHRLPAPRGLAISTAPIPATSSRSFVANPPRYASRSPSCRAANTLSARGPSPTVVPAPSPAMWAVPRSPTSRQSSYSKPNSKPVSR